MYTTIGTYIRLYHLAKMLSLGNTNEKIISTGNEPASNLNLETPESANFKSNCLRCVCVCVWGGGVGVCVFIIDS